MQLDDVGLGPLGVGTREDAIAGLCAWAPRRVTISKARTSLGRHLGLQPPSSLFRNDLSLMARPIGTHLHQSQLVVAKSGACTGRPGTLASGLGSALPTTKRPPVPSR